MESIFFALIIHLQLFYYKFIFIKKVMNFLYVSRGILFFAEKPHIIVITNIIEVNVLDHNRKRGLGMPNTRGTNNENCLVLSTYNND